jgi:Bacterial protein of unknown function (DUF853).
VAWTKLQAPVSLMGPLSERALDTAVSGSPMLAKYAEAIDRESAYEKLAAKVRTGAAPAETPAKPKAGGRPARARKEEKSLAEKVLGSPAARSFIRSAGTAAGRAIMRSVFGTARRR